jgi:hypothetical protein
VERPFDPEPPPPDGVLDKVPWSMRLLVASAFAFFLALLPWARWLGLLFRRRVCECASLA